MENVMLVICAESIQIYISRFVSYNNNYCFQTNAVAFSMEPHSI